MKNKLLIIFNLIFFISIFLFISNSVQAKEYPLGGLKGLETGYDVTGEEKIDVIGGKFEDIFSNIVGFLTILSGLYFFVMFIIGGLGWASAGGDSGKVDTAKNRMTNGVIGLIIVVAAYSVIFIVGTVLGIRILQPGEEIIKLSPNYTP